MYQRQLLPTSTVKVCLLLRGGEEQEQLAQEFRNALCV